MSGRSSFSTCDLPLVLGAGGAGADERLAEAAVPRFGGIAVEVRSAVPRPAAGFLAAAVFVGGLAAFFLLAVVAAGFAAIFLPAVVAAAGFAVFFRPVAVPPFPAARVPAVTGRAPRPAAGRFAVPDGAADGR
jgi:hypothetical protein